MTHAGLLTISDRIFGPTLALQSELTEARVFECEELFSLRQKLVSHYKTHQLWIGYIFSGDRMPAPEPAKVAGAELIKSAQT